MFSKKATNVKLFYEIYQVYYLIFEHFGGATNQDMLLTETSYYYCHVQQPIK